MKKALKTIKISVLPIFAVILFVSAGSNYQKLWKKDKPEQTTIIETLIDNTGYNINIDFKKGKRHNHPLFAFWIEDTLGNYIHTLYVSESIAKGFFKHGDTSTGRWQPGPLRRPAALPYWGHKRGIKAADGYYLPTQDKPMPDAVTGATPKNNFILRTKTEEEIPEVFNILMEVNQSWDWNHYWHNNKFPDDQEYKTSSQPALIYKATINTNDLKDSYNMHLIGHSHWSGTTGELFEDISTITTAQEITKSVKILITK
ncbi:MAG: hypothetical protein R6U11_01510 [Bacteroidales bacterium]